MDSASEDDFFCGMEQEEGPMNVDHTSFQPDEEMLPPENDDLGVEADIGAAVEYSIDCTPKSNRVSSIEDDVIPATLPLVDTESSSPTSTTSSPIRPERAVRFRLREKTAPRGDCAATPPHAHPVSWQPPAVPGVMPVAAAACEWWFEKSDKKKYLYVYNILKRSNAYNAWKLSLRKRLRDRLPSSWVELETDHKAQFLQWIVASFQPHLHEVVKSWTLNSLLSKTTRGRGGHWNEKRQARPRAGMQLLLTWQGPWGVLQSEKVSKASGASEATEILKKERYAIALWTKAKAALEVLQDELGAAEWCAALELCTRTLETGTIRLHLHACFVARSAPLKDLEISELAVFGTQPHISTEDKKKTRKRRAAQFSAFYYLCAPKIGSMFTHSTMRANHDYEVNAEWIWSMVAMNKVELPAARRELVAQGKNLSRHLPNLDILEKERQKNSVSEVIASRDDQIAETRNDFREIEIVSSWVRELSAPRDRRKFLVLDGPSRMGKTAFACSLVARGGTLEVNCAGVSDPPLRAFSRGKHRLILFDEASTDMVLRNRRLFQSPNTGVTVGSSPTNALAYEVYLNDTLLVVASNNWQQELAALPPSQHSWLEANMIFVSVKQKLFKEA